MVYLNYNNLNEETKERLLQNSKKDVEQKFGEDIKAYANKHHINYDAMIEEEAIRNLYSYRYIFNI
jgi:hypothetical protein